MATKGDPAPASPSLDAMDSAIPPPASYIDTLASHAISSAQSTLPPVPSSTTSFHHSNSNPSHPLDSSVASQQYSEMMAQNDLLSKENRLFDSFLQRTADVRMDLDRSPKHGKREKNRTQYEPTLSDVSAHTLHTHSPPFTFLPPHPLF